MAKLTALGGIGAVLLIVMFVLMSYDVMGRIQEMTRLGRLMLAMALCSVGGLVYLYLEGTLGYWYWLYEVPARPQAELSFVSRAENALREWQATTAAHGAQQDCGAWIMRMAKAIVPVENWAGTVATTYGIGPNIVVVVRVGRYTQVRTSYNESGDAVLIGPGSPIFEEAKALQSGDSVRFSGVITKEIGRCPFQWAAEDPGPTADFVLRFSAIHRV